MAKCQYYAGVMPDKNSIEIPVDIAAIKLALQQPLAFVDAAERRSAVQAYLEGASFYLERALIQFMSSVAADLNNQADLVARVEYRQEAPCLVIERRGEGLDESAAFVEGDLEKITIRVPRDLKSMIDRLASGEGLSANSWYIRELARTISRFSRDLQHEETRQGRRGNRSSSLKGFVGGE